MTQAANKKEIFSYLFLLTAFFLLLELSFFIQCNKAYLSDFSYVSASLPIPLAVLPGIFAFLLIELALHIGYALFVGWIGLSLTRLLRLSTQQSFVLVLSLWVLGVVTALVANQYFFPNSRFAELTAFVFFNRSFLYGVFLVLTASCSLIIGLWVLWCLWRLLKRPLYIILAAGLFFCLHYFFLGSSNVIVSANLDRTPNIILIGVDSLRPDFLSFFGAQRETPFMDSFLNEATVFSEAVTPLARTFPAWVSILTGKYPLHTGIRFNLASQAHFDYQESLANQLHAEGYETVFATDETRFSNIDNKFGFDQVLAPPMGLNDFLLGTFNDFPFSNLLINTPLGRWLFPYNYANRAANFTYQPNSFLRLVDEQLSNRKTKPLFLAIHFCLPHFPYLWADLEKEYLSITQQYQESVLRVDEQIKVLFRMLKQYGLLDYAIVVLLSDHGEALELPGDRITEKSLFVFSVPNQTIPKFYPPTLEEEGFNQSAGHGTDVLGLPQYHSVLAMKRYGIKAAEPHKIVSGVVSLLDIKPTILDWLNLHSKGDGISLAPFFTPDPKVVPLRHVFIESDYSPEAIRTVYPNTRQVLLEGAHLFQIDPLSTRLTMKPAMADMIIGSKQYADIYGDWMLALYPQPNRSYISILINLSNGYWSDDLQSSFAVHSPANEMLQQLQAFYGDEIARS